MKQGRIHGYPNHVWLGRGSDGEGHWSIWAEVMSPKRSTKGRTDRRTDGWTAKWGVELHSTQLKIIPFYSSRIHWSMPCYFKVGWEPQSKSTLQSLLEDKRSSRTLTGKDLNYLIVAY